MGTEAPVLGTLWILPWVALHLGIHSSMFFAYPLLYKKLVNISVSLNARSHSSKLLNPVGGGVMVMLVYNWSVRNTAHNLGLVTGVLKWASLVGLKSSLTGFDPTFRLIVSELN